MLLTLSPDPPMTCPVRIYRPLHVLVQDLVFLHHLYFSDYNHTLVSFSPCTTELGTGGVLDIGPCSPAVQSCLIGTELPYTDVCILETSV
jgi:hypothetical protein